jgi:hypothetical protein
MIAQFVCITTILECGIHCFGDKLGYVQSNIDRLHKSSFLKRRSKDRYKYRQRFKLTTQASKKIIRIGKAMFIGYNAMAFSGSVSNISSHDEQTVAYNSTARFDTDSVPIKIDNCCTQTMTGYRNDFIPSSLRTIEGKHVTGFAQTKTAITHIGTVKWNVTDNLGMHHDICIPNTYYVPNCKLRLLSPQHWAQEANDNKPLSDGTWCATYKDRVVMKWNQQRHTKTIAIDPSKGNVATMWTS